MYREAIVQLARCLQWSSGGSAVDCWPEGAMSLLLYKDARVAVVLTDSKAGKRGDMPAIYVYGRNGKADSCPETCGMYHKGCYARSGREGLLERNAWSFAAIATGSVATSLQLRAMIRGRLVRSAAIGDLGMVLDAVGIVARLLECGAAGIIGYTHTDVSLPGHMRSVDSLAQAEAAWSVGRRTFRVLPAGVQAWRGRNALGEVACPSWASGGRVTCDRCKLCDGDNGKPSVAISAHGTQRKAVVG